MTQEQEINANFSLNENDNLNSAFEISENEEFDTVFRVDATPYKTSQLINDSFIESIEGNTLIDVQTDDFAATVTSKTYIHEQALSSDVWNIIHNLNKYPSVTLVDTAGTQFHGRVEYIDNNTCKVYMNGNTKGKAYLN